MSDLTFTHLSPQLARTAADRVPLCETAAELAVLVLEVRKWQRRGYLNGVDVETVTDAIEESPIQLDADTLAELQALVDSIEHAGSKTVTENGTYDPQDDMLDYYDEVTVNVTLYPFTHGIAYTEQDVSLSYETSARGTVV